MPTIVENAIIEAYKSYGWDINTGNNYLCDDPWAESNALPIWPTFSDMLEKLDGVIQSAGMGKEFEEKYKGSLISRLSALTTGIKGRMLNTQRSFDFSTLLDKKIVIELDELKDEEDKALFMGLIISRMAESIKYRHRKQPDFQHITLIEEAHRLLSRPEPGEDNSKKMGVEMFANMLAEVRKYGESLIIADQIPNKLIADVIKNTNTKIVHRLFAADDCNTIGDAIGLSDAQKGFLRQLQPGEVVIYCGGWHAAVRAKVPHSVHTGNAEIDESVFVRCGQAQLWQNRHRILPRLSQCTDLASNMQKLFDFMHQGADILNLFLQLNQEVYRPNRSESKLDLMVQRLSAKLDQQQQNLHINLDKTIEYLLLLLWDRVPFSPDENDIAILSEQIKPAIQAIYESTNAYITFSKTVYARDLLDPNKNFSLTSI